MHSADVPVRTYTLKRLWAGCGKLSRSSNRSRETARADREGEKETVKYDSSYFEWQKGIGEFGAEVDFFKVADRFTNPNQSVLEFGCGGGFWLAKIKTIRVLRVEINPIANRKLRQNRHSSRSEPQRCGK